MSYITLTMRTSRRTADGSSRELCLFDRSRDHTGLVAATPGGYGKFTINLLLINYNTL